MDLFDGPDFSVGAIIEEIPSMSRRQVKEYEEFISCIENHDNKCRMDISIIEGKDYINSSGKYPELFRRNREQFATQNTSFKQVLEEKRDEVEQLVKIKKDLEEIITQNKQKAESIRQKISNSKEKMKKLEEKRNKILVYNLLTKTSFCYKGNTVSGYVADPNTKKIKGFDLNLEKFSQKEITQTLYETMKKVTTVTSEQREANKES
ncbi:hypothetical protein JTB14_031843 [Gonioctena quinquepunctata]|nr:hypothetical protein JTB14_031843 [Gonioctena quinquepunctata]